MEARLADHAQDLARAWIHGDQATRHGICKCTFCHQLKPPVQGEHNVTARLGGGCLLRETAYFTAPGIHFDVADPVAPSQHGFAQPLYSPFAHLVTKAVAQAPHLWVLVGIYQAHVTQYVWCQRKRAADRRIPSPRLDLDLYTREVVAVLLDNGHRLE